MNQHTDASQIDVESGLTIRQRLFCAYYMIHLNAGKAYLEAGYSAKNKKQAITNAHALLKRQDIKCWLAKAKREQIDRVNEQIRELFSVQLPENVEYNTAEDEAV